MTLAQESILSKGLNFAPAPRSIPTAQLVAAVENTIFKSQVPQEAKNRARTRIVGVLAKARPPASNLKPEETKALKQIKSDMSLAIVPADKGNCTVVLDRVQYDSKILSMLNDVDTYEKLPKDPTSTLERRMNAVLLRLRRSGHLSEAQYNRLRSSAGRIPLIYGLPKIHKADVPLRPIVSFVSSPTYQLSKHLCYLLRPLQGHTESTIHNSKQFSTFIATQEVAHEESLVSFDVVSLFTRVPDLATYLAFRGSFYRQIHGTAMGSPVSVTVANLVMEDVKQRALATFPNPPKFWKRYVDDTCCALATSDIDRFHQHINSIEPHIQFTVEIETNGPLPFLDLLLRREEDGSISTSVYRKPTNTDRYLDFSSHHPQAHKAAVVRTLMNRAKVLPSTVLARTDEEVQVTAAL